MANVKIEEVEGGETTTVTSSHSLELDDGVNSTWVSVVNLAVYVWNYLTSLTAKTTLVDADQIPLADSAASNAGKKITWQNLMAQAAAYAQTLTNKTLTTPTIADFTNAQHTHTGESSGGAISTKLEGLLNNGKISVTVASNNITVALKTWAGADPSSSDPVKVYINGNERTITSPLSVTVNAAANSFNAGSSELATKEIDHFVYLSWRAASSAVVIGFARFPFARVYSDFSGTATNEKYAAFSTAPASTDDVVNIGRFAATLSAGAGYTWSVPTFTSVNLIQRPIYETRWLNWQPVYSGYGSLTYTSVTTTLAKYRITPSKCDIQFRFTGTTGGTTSNAIYATVPFEASQSAIVPCVGAMFYAVSTQGFGGILITAGTPDKLTLESYNDANWPLTANALFLGNGFYEI